MKSILIARHLLFRKVRHIIWRIKGSRLATSRSAEQFPYIWAEFSCPVVNHPTQQQLVASKVANMHLAAETFDGLVLQPGEYISFWALIGKPDDSSKYVHGPTFINGKVETSIGGGLCQISGLVFNLALESGLEILERHSHTLDAYGERRYLPLGRDSTVAWKSKDLAFRNNFGHAVRLQINVEIARVSGCITGAYPKKNSVKFEQVFKKLSGDDGNRTLTTISRTVTSEDGQDTSQNFTSLYRHL